MSAFTIDLATLRNGFTHVDEEARARDLGLPEAEWPDLVRGSFDVEKSGDRISVRGTLETRVRLECVRCLTGLELPLRVPLEVFAERSGKGSRRDEESLDRDDYMRFHDGRRLNLTEDAREALLLEVPMTPLCREECAGLCPRCGAELNLGPHACQGP